jgi:hypothetical protein
MFEEPSTSGTNYTSFKAGVQSANITYTLPTSQGAAGSILTNDGSGNLSWGNGGVSFVQKSTTQSVTSSTTLVDDNAFTFTLAANKTYEVTGVLRMDCGSTGHMKVQFVAPTSSTEFITAFVNRSAQDDVTYILSPTTSYDISSLGTTSSTTDMVEVKGIVTTSSTSGTFKLQWAQQTSSSTATTVYSGSYIKVTLVQ